MKQTGKILLDSFKWLRLGKRNLSEISPPVRDCSPDLDDRGICTVDPCDPEKCLDEPRVVIVGAGMAGLAAAARLSQNGINNISILEAYERPGGRIQSCWIGDVVAELGAHWRPDTCCTHPLYKVSACEDPPMPGVPGVVHSRGLFNTFGSGPMDIPPTISAYYKFKQIEEEAAQIYCLGGSKQHGSLLNFMSIRIQQELHEFPEEQQHDVARIMFGLCHMLSARCGDDTAMLRADHQGCFMNMPGGDVRVPLGLVGILAPLLRQIPEGAIHYCKPVNVIYWGTSQKSGYRATVVTGDGQEFPADYVIITVSLGVLCNNCLKMFCPALPSSKIEAMKCLGFGCCNKIYLEYCRPFWYWHKGLLNFSLDDNPLSASNWCAGIKAIESVPNSNHVLCAWVIGKEAYMMEGVCDKDIAVGITDVLRKLTSNKNIPYPTNLIRSHWSSDPFFNGAFSYNLGEANGKAQRALASPLPGPGEPIPPVLLFAGEATVPGHFATVDGARLSGIREAERVVQLTRQYRGPPLSKQMEVQCKQLKAQA